MGYSVRRIEAGEWREFRDIRLEALQDTPIGFGELYADALVRPEAFWRRRAERGAREPDTALFVAVDDPGRFVGMTGVFSPDPAAGPEMVLYTVYVSPEHRGTARGVALRQAPAGQPRRCLASAMNGMWR